MIVYITKARHTDVKDGWDLTKDPHPGFMAVDMSKWLPRTDHNMSFEEYCKKYEVKNSLKSSLKLPKKKSKKKSKKK